MSIPNDISNKKYLVHFKRNPITNTFINLSEDNFNYSILNPTNYSSSKLTTENLTSFDLTEYGIGFAKNSTGFSPFISIENLNSYIDLDINFTIYFRVNPISTGLNNITIDLYNTILPGTDESNVSKYFKFGIYNGVLTFISKTDNTFSFEYNLSKYTESKQYHICLTRMNKVLRAYIDGHKIYDSYYDKMLLYTNELFFIENKITNIYIGKNTGNNKVYLDDITICKNFAFYGYVDFEVPRDALNPKSLLRNIESNKTITFKVTKITYNDNDLYTNTYRKINKNNKISYNTKRNVIFEKNIITKYNVNRIVSKNTKPLFNLFRNIISKYEIKSNLLRFILNKDSVFNINTMRKINQTKEKLYNTNRIVYYTEKKNMNTVLRYIKDNVFNMNVKRNVVINYELINNTERTVLNFKMKIVAFITNPLYVRKKGM